MGAAALAPQAVVQQDVVLVTAEHRLVARSDQSILMVDSSKFASSSGAIVCGLEEIDILINDDGVTDAVVQAMERAGARVIVA